MEKCNHPSMKLSKINNSEECSYCQNCGLILYHTKNNKLLNTIKPLEHESKTETDPIELFLNSYKETPFEPLEKDSLYPEKRTRAIKILEKFNNLYHYSDEIFFLALTYMDYIFKFLYNNKNNNKTITRKNEELYILNCLLIAEKFYDKDINTIPDYNIYIKSTIYEIDTMDIKENEIECLKILKYKLDHHSLYDILRAYMYNGFIFEKEVDSSSIIYQIKFAYNYAEKLFRDIVYSYIAIFYPPYLVAFVIIQLTRKKFFDSKYMKKIKKVYGIKQNDYKECYDDIKSLLNNIEKGLKINDYNKMKSKEENEKKEDDKNEINKNGNENNSSVVNQIKEITEQTSNINLENKDKENNVSNNNENKDSINLNKNENDNKIE